MFKGDIHPSGWIGSTRKFSGQEVIVLSETYTFVGGQPGELHECR